MGPKMTRKIALVAPKVPKKLKPGALFTIPETDCCPTSRPSHPEASFLMIFAHFCDHPRRISEDFSFNFGIVFRLPAPKSCQDRHDPPRSAKTPPKSAKNHADQRPHRRALLRITQHSLSSNSQIAKLQMRGRRCARRMASSINKFARHSAHGRVRIPCLVVLSCYKNDPSFLLYGEWGR